MTATTQNPKVFISYSWTDSDHELFVLELATALRNHGVDAILDKWDLKPGQDKFVFMESMVTDTSVSRVLVICDKKYQEKADARAGGVGTESQIISQELYGRVKQTKFIPIVRQYDEEMSACLPVFMKGLIYVDMSSDERYGTGLEELLRLIYEQPLYQKPSLGAPPIFTSNVGIPHAKELPAVARSIQDGKANRQGLETIFLRSVLSEVEKLYAEPTGNDYHEVIYQEIAATKGLRDQISDYCETVAVFSSDDPDTLAPFCRLLEGIASHFGPPERNGSFYPGWTDLYGYFALEIFLIQVAALLRHRRWKSLRRLLNSKFIVRDVTGQMNAGGFCVFNSALVSMDEHRNSGLSLRRVSLSADLLKERSSVDKTSFLEIQEADVFLTLASMLKLETESRGGWRRFWIPRTGVYFNYSTRLPLFIRAADEYVRLGIHHAIQAESGKTLKAQLDEAAKHLGGFRGLAIGHSSDFDFLVAINANELTR